MSYPTASPGPYYWHGCQYTLVRNWHRQYELTDIAGRVLATFTVRYLHQRISDGAARYGWYLDGFLVACTPLEAVNRYLASCEGIAAPVGRVAA